MPECPLEPKAISVRFRRRQKAKRYWRALPMLSVWLRDLIISLAISAFIIVFIYQPVKVEGTSMMPSLEDQERIFVNKYVYRLEPISAWRHCCFSLSSRSVEKFYQTGDRRGGRPHSYRRREVFVNGKRWKKIMFRQHMPINGRILKSWCRRIAISCLEITASCRTTAGISGRWIQAHLWQGGVWVLADG